MQPQNHGNRQTQNHSIDDDVRNYIPAIDGVSIETLCEELLARAPIGTNRSTPKKAGEEEGDGPAEYNANHAPA